MVGAFLLGLGIGSLAAGLTADRTVYTASKLTDGTSTSNDDRNYNQFGGLGRVSYDLIPGLKPFGEIDGNVRFTGKGLKQGDIVQVKITKSDEYDLFGKAV